MDKIGPYEILETLHRGAQPLYKAKAADGRVVAVKTTPVAGLTPEHRERFLREAETCRGLDHPNLVRVFESGEANGVLFQAMELLEGSDLGKVMASGRKFNWDEKLSIMEQVCDGLQYAHEHKLVHRDIKPANLFLENNGRVRVVDFGMVRVAESELTKVGSSVGTLNYMSPEQIRGERCTTATDVFSTGIVFYQLASGHHPFSRKDRSLVQVVSAIVFENPPALSGLCPDAPEGLEFILNKALEKDPAKRIQNAGDLKQAMALCRITMKLAPPPAPAAPRPAAPQVAFETKLMPSAQVQAGAANPAPQAPPAPTPDPTPLDEQKTKVFRRQAPVGPIVTPSVDIPKPAAPPPPPPPPAPRPNPPPPPQPEAQRPKFCPSCTTANPPGATVCRGCGNPLGGPETINRAEAPIQWGMYLAIGVAVLLAFALIVVLIVKK
jgi:serine/threonine protein kinase